MAALPLWLLVTCTLPFLGAGWCFWKAKQFRAKPAKATFLDLLHSSMPDAKLTLWFILRSGGQQYNDEIAGWLLSESKHFSGIAGIKTIVDTYLHVASRKLRTKLIHRYGFSEPPPAVGDLVTEALEARNYNVISFAGRYHKSEDTIGEWLCKNWQEPQPGVTGQQRFYPEPAADALEELPPEVCGRILRRICQEGHWDALMHVGLRETEKAELCGWVEEHVLKSDAAKTATLQEAGKWARSLGCLSPGLALRVVNEWLKHNPKAVPEEGMPLIDAIAKSASEKKLAVEPAALAAFSRERVAAKMPPQGGGYAQLLAGSYLISSDPSPIWDCWANLDEKSQRSFVKKLLWGLGDTEDKAAAQALIAKFTEAPLRQHLYPLLSGLVRKKAYGEVVWSWLNGLREEKEQQVLYKNCIVRLAADEVGDALEELDEVFVGEARPTEPPGNVLKIDSTRTAEEYCRITGKAHYFSTGKSWPPACRRSLSHAREIELTRQFIDKYPWFPGLDDAWYRLVFLQTIDVGRAEALQTAAEALEHDLVDMDAIPLVGLAFRYALDRCASPPALDGTAGHLAAIFQEPLGLLITRPDRAARLPVFCDHVDALLKGNNTRFLPLDGIEPMRQSGLLAQLRLVSRRLLQARDEERLSLLAQLMRRVESGERAALLFFHWQPERLPAPPADAAMYQASDLDKFQRPRQDHRAALAAARALANGPDAVLAAPASSYVEVLEALTGTMNADEALGPPQSGQSSGTTPADGDPAAQQRYDHDLAMLVARKLGSVVKNSRPSAELPVSVVIWVDRRGRVDEVVVIGQDRHFCRTLEAALLNEQPGPPPIDQGWRAYRKVITLQNKGGTQ